ncbi:MAG: nitroreductase family protein, partial [Syntrophales bacterium LBB04]|nr:nitroreductase family protein [Syntrophales bacterium LBB04]
MLTTKDAIERRRSIRKFKPDPVSEEQITALLDAARLAPSGSNAQPWRFKVVKESDTKLKLAQSAFGQSFIAAAPAVFICCVLTKSYYSAPASKAHDLGRSGIIDQGVAKLTIDGYEKTKPTSEEHLAARVAFNVAIAGEHMVLRALDFGLGTCWIRMFDEKKIKDIFGWDNSLHV